MPHIPNNWPQSPKRVFHIATPRHLFMKFHWEVAGLKRELAAQGFELSNHLDASYYAFNAAVTAWHLSDWVWAAISRNEDHVKEYGDALGIDLLGVKRGRPRLELFQAHLLKRSRALEICRDIANGSKHGDEHPESKVEVELQWAYLSEEKRKSGAPAYQFELLVMDNGNQKNVLDVFKEMKRFWEDVLSTWGFIEPRFIHPDMSDEDA